jgi:hypothetical protein
LDKRWGYTGVLSASFQIGDLNAFYQEAKKNSTPILILPDRARKRRCRFRPAMTTATHWTRGAFAICGVSWMHFDEHVTIPGGLAASAEMSFGIRSRKFVQQRTSDGRGRPKAIRVWPWKATAPLVVFIDGPDKAAHHRRKSDGGYLYATTDLAAIRYRVKPASRPAHYLRSRFARQAHHFAQLFATAKKAGWPAGPMASRSLEYAPFGTMLGEDGKPFKTRSGGTVKLKDLLDEAEQRALAVVTAKNPDLPRRAERSRSPTPSASAASNTPIWPRIGSADYVFSFDKMLALDGNTAPYLQYAHARIRSIFRKAVQASIVSLGGFDLGISPFELSLAKHILRLGEVIERRRARSQAALLCTYLYDLASDQVQRLLRELPGDSERRADCD